jgi:hypothetical protein
MRGPLQLGVALRPSTGFDHDDRTRGAARGSPQPSPPLDELVEERLRAADRAEQASIPHEQWSDDLRVAWFPPRDEPFRAPSAAPARSPGASWIRPRSIRHGPAR